MYLIYNLKHKNYLVYFSTHINNFMANMTDVKEDDTRPHLLNIKSEIPTYTSLGHEDQSSVNSELFRDKTENANEGLRINYQKRAIMLLILITISFSISCTLIAFLCHFLKTTFSTQKKFQAPKNDTNNKAVT